MAKLIFYRQRRVDGGTRMGVRLADLAILRRFEPGRGERNPIMAWFVDVRCTGSGIPEDPDAAIRWLFDASARVARSLSDFADHLRREGVTLDIDPLQWDEASQPEDDSEIKIVCLINRRIDAEEIAAILDDVRDHWAARIQQMVVEHESSPA